MTLKYKTMKECDFMKKIEFTKKKDDFSNHHKFPRYIGLLITNMTTILRFLGIFPIVYTFLSNNMIKTGVLTALVGITDKLDGASATYLNGKSKFGAWLDASTDKLFATVINVLLLSKNPLFLLNLVGEIEIGLLNSYYFFFKKINNQSTILGKIKTTTLFMEYVLSFLFINHPRLDVLIPIMILGNFVFQQKVLFEYQQLAKEKLDTYDTIQTEEIKEKMTTSHEITYHKQKEQIKELKELKNFILNDTLPKENQYEIKEHQCKIKIKKY